MQRTDFIEKRLLYRNSILMLTYDYKLTNGRFAAGSLVNTNSCCVNILKWYFS